jgi:hypothetical protein
MRRENALAHARDQLLRSGKDPTRKHEIEMSVKTHTHTHMHIDQPLIYTKRSKISISCSHYRTSFKSLWTYCIESAQQFFNRSNRKEMIKTVKICG